VKFTFGIITHGKSPHISQVLTSILNLNIPKDKFEIIVVGGVDVTGHDDNIRWFDFNETLKETQDIARFGWITVKKNIITQNAKYENIVFSHDYYFFNPGWYEGYLGFGNDWDICMNVIKRKEGDRFRDWAAWDDRNLCFTAEVDDYERYKLGNYGKDHRVVLVPYSYNKTENLYVSGGYWVAKKSHMIKFPLNELLRAGGADGIAEDVSWSKEWSGHVSYRMNVHSSNTVLKLGKRLSCNYSLDGKTVSDRCPMEWAASGWERRLS